MRLTKEQLIESLGRMGMQDVVEYITSLEAELISLRPKAGTFEEWNKSKGLIEWGSGYGDRKEAFQAGFAAALAESAEREKAASEAGHREGHECAIKGRHAGPGSCEQSTSALDACIAERVKEAKLETMVWLMNRLPGRPPQEVQDFCAALRADQPAALMLTVPVAGVCPQQGGVTYHSGDAASHLGWPGDSKRR